MVSDPAVIGDCTTPSDDAVGVICAELGLDIKLALDVVVIRVLVEELWVFEVTEVLEVEVTAQV